MFVYADNAATTKMSKTAIDAMLPYLDTWYGNASSLYEFGQKSAEALAAARETVAGCLGAEAREITFTSGGSESDNQAILSAAAIGARKGKKHIISTAFEHHAVLHTLKKLEKYGYDITLLDVHENGIVTPEQVRDVLLACDREQAGPTLPACGLFMNRLWYDDTPELDRFHLSD